MRRLRPIVIASAICICTSGSAGEDARAPVFKDPARSVEERVADLLGRLTPDEKISLVSGKDGMNTMDIGRLGISSLKMSDGPHGVNCAKSVCFPTSIGMGATWNTELIGRVGVALAEEARALGRNMVLGPCVNISRIPLGGRNFESFGEDPWLAARMAVAYVKGVQSRGIATSVKHYAVNNQETERGSISVEVDERALREIYLPAFRAAVTEADAFSVMSAYNKLRGSHCSENVHLQNEILKGEWGFKGLVVSDWGATHDTVAAANGGLDLEMPGPGSFFGAPLKAAVEKGDVSQGILDDKVRRILRVQFQMGLFDGTYANDRGATDTPEHRALAREVAREAITLIKNDRAVLPLDDGKIRTLAVIGPNAETARLGGSGSSMVTPNHSVGPLEGIRQRCGSRVEVRFAPGCMMPGEGSDVPSECLVPEGATGDVHGLRAEYFNNANLEGPPVLTRIDPQVGFRWDGSPAEGIKADGFSVRWTGKLVVPEDGEYEVGVRSDDGARLFFDGRLVVDIWSYHPVIGRSVRMHLKKGETHDVRIEYFEAGGAGEAHLTWSVAAPEIRKAAELAAECDAAVVCVGLSDSIEGEGLDRGDMDLPRPQAQLIEAVAAANSNTVVLYVGGTPVVMEPWIQRVPALVAAWYPGQEGGDAIADVLFGDVSPSGKLPVTFPKKLEDNPSFGNFPGGNGVVRYEEGLLVGYRHYDTKGVEPQFPFGHGLSYTEFKYGNLQIDPAKLAVSFDVENAGERPGKEVAQLYIRDVESSLPRPLQELKRFEKVDLKPGEKKTVAFALDQAALSFYDPDKTAWVAEPGEFEVLVGSSSRDIRLKGRFDYPPSN